MLNDQIIMLQHGSSNSNNQSVDAHSAHVPLICMYDKYANIPLPVAQL